MRLIIRISSVVALLLTVGLNEIVFADTYDTVIYQAMQSLKVNKDDPGLLIITDAPYVKVDGTNALAWLDQAQEQTGCTVGKGNLLFFQRPQIHPFRLMLFSKKASVTPLSAARCGVRKTPFRWLWIARPARRA